MAEERTFTKAEVNSKKTGATIGGIFIGIAASIATGIIVNKVSKGTVNITTKTTDAVDKVVARIKSKKDDTAPAKK
jgi:hypothetical protein